MSKKYIVDTDRLVPFDKAKQSLWEEAYQHGLDDAWYAAKKIALPYEDGGYSYDELNECLGETRGTVNMTLKNTPVTEVIKKIREYEAQKKQDTEIHIGDEVYFTMFGRKIKGIAVDRELSGTWNLLGEKGALMEIGTADLTKTGRHVDLSEFFGGE